jgi:hypothetical protein
MPALRPRLARALAGVEAAPWCQWTRIVHAGGCWRCDGACADDRDGPNLAPRSELLTVSEAHQLAVPRGLKIQAPEPDFEPGGEGVRTAHGVTLTTVLGANHHRESR